MIERGRPGAAGLSGWPGSARVLRSDRLMADQMWLISILSPQLGQ